MNTPFTLRVGPEERPLVCTVRMGRRDMKSPADVQDPLHYPQPEIRIRRGMTEKETVGALIHEVLHLSDWNLSEIFVLDTERVIVECLVKGGFIKDEE